MKLLATVSIIIVSAVTSTAMICGTAYIVFWMGFSGWWWLLTATLLQGECVSTYKFVNAILLGQPAKTSGM